MSTKFEILYTFSKGKKYFYPSKCSVAVILIFRGSDSKVTWLTSYFNVLYSFCIAVFLSCNVLSSLYDALSSSCNVVSSYDNVNALSSAYHGSKIQNLISDY